MRLPIGYPVTVRVIMVGPEEIRPLQAGENLRDPERFKLITVERVWDELFPMLEKYFYGKKRIEKSEVISSSGKISFDFFP